MIGNHEHKTCDHLCNGRRAQKVPAALPRYRAMPSGPVGRVPAARRGSSSLTTGQPRRGDKQRTLLTGRLDALTANVEQNSPFRSDAQPAADHCSSCEHPLAAHDQVAHRCCEATLRMVLTRRCICRGDPAGAG